MEVVALSLLLLLDSLDSASARVSLTVLPDSLQFFKYDSFCVSCEEEEEEEQSEAEKEVTEWMVMKRTQDGEVTPCLSSCCILAAFPATDSGVYWCESGLGETSTAVNITVTAGSVRLQSPVLPVTEGDNVTLTCTCRSTTSAWNFTAHFYKDGVFIGTSSTGDMTLLAVSSSDEGRYRCSVGGFGDSPQSWLTITAPPTAQDPPVPPLSVSTLLRHLVVGTPYLLSTVLLGLVYRARARAQQTSKAEQMSNDVIMEMAT